MTIRTRQILALWQTGMTQQAIASKLQLSLGLEV
jgi:DNA-binding CsgD family transcriptional regulator